MGIPRVARCKPTSKLDFDPLPTIPKYSRKLDRPFPILTGEKSRKQLSGIEQRNSKQGETRTQKRKAFLKKNQPQWNQDCDEDIDETKTKCNGWTFSIRVVPNTRPSGANTGTDSCLTNEALALGSKAKDQKLEGETTNSLLKVYDDHRRFKQDG
ncbi:hypothetical protein OUZ56_029721 [Daphnia magna]|uniref:Uncharacterized protein n=1 Tax=Daphnia magna TaxID=35525 RepID=A0ABR0B7M7_9CRUS|nr:hypothetical protein OUZ56_029721 [Daphnia magna]